MTSDEKQAFANEAEKALDHPLVRDVIEEFADNMGFALEGLPFYGIMKVAMYTATVARAQALGIDPDELRHTPEEADAAMLRKMHAAVDAGVPTMVVVTDDHNADAEQV